MDFYSFKNQMQKLVVIDFPHHMIKEIRQELNIALAEYEKADKRLEEWEKGEYKGKKLGELEDKLERRSWRDEEEKAMWKDKVKKLEDEKKLLVESRVRWEVLYQELLLGGEGNEQIA